MEGFKLYMEAWRFSLSGWIGRCHSLVIVGAEHYTGGSCVYARPWQIMAARIAAMVVKHKLSKQQVGSAVLWGSAEVVDTCWKTS